MEFDIVPELLEKIKADYEKNMAAVNSEEVLDKLFKSGNYEDAYDYAKKMAKALSDSYIKNITDDVLPNGRMYYNIANRIFPETIRNAYLNMAVVTTNIQENINKKAGIGIKAQTPNYNADRARGMVEKIAEAESFDEVKFMIKPPVIENITQSVVDDTIKTNAEFHYKSGLRARVERKLGGKCCDWCQRLVGKYSYPDVPEDVYRRHDNCRCTVTYYPSKTGKGQDVWSKNYVSEDWEEYNEQSLRTKRSSKKEYGVQWNKIKTSDYIDRLSDVSDDEYVKEKIAVTSRNILRNRDGKNTEEIYAISLNSGKKISSITDQHKAFYIKRTDKFFKDIKRAENNNDKVLFIHNHPRGLPPSAADVNELLSHNSAVGITVGHNGSIYYYTKPSKIITDDEYALALDHFKYYNDDVLRNEKTLERLARLYDFEFKIL